MMSPACEKALEDVALTGIAILKFISANDVDVTGGHQSGYYLPKAVWRHFTTDPPDKNRNSTHRLNVVWQDGRQTPSAVKWYGRGTRNEYRLTRFGRDFRWRTADNLGNLLVLVPKSLELIHAYVLDLEEDIDEFQVALGVEVIESWALYDKDVAKPQDDNCLNIKFREFALRAKHFPDGKLFSSTARSALLDCTTGFAKLTPDERLIRLIREEYELFKMVERKIRQPEVQRLFSSVDDFLQTAQTILQSRKSRAGRSLENHTEYILRQAQIPFEMRQDVDGTRPDIIIPSKACYEDAKYPTNRLFMVGIKTTCKDRWRQVIQEAPRIRRKNILTLQKGISLKQLKEMFRARVELIVPESLHREYPREFRHKLLSLSAFITRIRSFYPHA